MMLPASCRRPSHSRMGPPTAPAPGSACSRSTARRRVWGSTMASLFSSTRWRPRACAAAWFTASRKPRFCPGSSTVAPSTRASSCGVRSLDALSTISVWKRTPWPSASDCRHSRLRPAWLNSTTMTLTSGSASVQVRSMRPLPDRKSPRAASASARTRSLSLAVAGGGAGAAAVGSRCGDQRRASARPSGRRSRPSRRSMRCWLLSGRLRHTCRARPTPCRRSASPRKPRSGCVTRHDSDPVTAR